MATIEIQSRDVTGTSYLPGSTPQHLYLVYTDDTGNEYMLRGGPSTNMITGDLDVIDDVYKPLLSNKQENPDWDYNNTHKSQTIYSGTQAEVSAIWSKMQAKATQIDSN